MSKIGLGGTIFTIFTGSIFMVVGLIVILWESISLYEFSAAGFCTLAGVIIILYGITLVIGAFWQWRKIRSGKVFLGPPDELK